MPRDAMIDVMRGFCMIYIVGFWHQFSPGFGLNAYFVHTTVIVLGMFVFLSGWLLAQRSIQSNVQSFSDFYWRRLLRIYPLYLASLGIFVWIGLTPEAVAIKSLAALSMFSGPPPLTLWYVAMLLFFYLLAPLLIASAKDPLRFLATASVSYGLLALSSRYFPSFDIRLVMYFPAFAAGIFFAKRDLGGSAAPFASVAFAAICISVISRGNAEHSINSAPMAAFVPLALVALLLPLKVPTRLVPIVTAIGYASFVAYLAHRPIQMAMHKLGWFQPIWLRSLMLVVFSILAGWAIQYGYDRLLSYANRRRQFAIGKTKSDVSAGTVTFRIEADSLRPPIVASPAS